MSFVTNFAYCIFHFLFIFDDLHTSFMITVYNLGNIQNKALNYEKKIEEKNMEEVSV